MTRRDGFVQAKPPMLGDVWIKVTKSVSCLETQVFTNLPHFLSLLGSSVLLDRSDTMDFSISLTCSLLFSAPFGGRGDRIDAPLGHRRSFPAVPHGRELQAVGLGGPGTLGRTSVEPVDS